jgi:hypothetical protein
MKPDARDVSFNGISQASDHQFAEGVGNQPLQEIVESGMYLAVRSFPRLLKNLQAVAEAFRSDGHGRHSMARFVFRDATDSPIEMTRFI